MLKARKHSSPQMMAAGHMVVSSTHQIVAPEPIGGGNHRDDKKGDGEDVRTHSSDITSNSTPVTTVTSKQQLEPDLGRKLFETSARLMAEGEKSAKVGPSILRNGVCACLPGHSLLGHLDSQLTD